jgi:prepilin-type N-terminal cleavage/methylation domain-containing protein
MRGEGRRGFTLVELLVATVILGIVTVALLSSLTTQQKSVANVDQLTEAQQNLRVIGELMERDIRHAGFMVPESAALCGIDNTNAPDRFYVSDANAIQPELEKSADLGAELTGGANNIAPGLQTVNVDSVVLEEATPLPSYDTDGDGNNDADFRDEAGVIVVDRNNPRRGVACGNVTAVPSATSLRLDIASQALAPLVVGDAAPQLVAIPAHEYFVDATLRLIRDGFTVSHDVEDLQIGYFFDLNGDNVIDPNEYHADGVGPDYDARAVNGEDIREVRANVVMRTRFPDPDNTQGQFQVTENRLAVAGNDGFRRRAYTTTVMLRNVGSRYTP